MQLDARIEILGGDITEFEVDAIVNAANRSLLGGGGVDGAIHDAAGPELYEACLALKGCLPGQAKLTPGFRLPARYILHTVGPIWHGGSQGEEEILASCYRACLAIARERGFLSLAFPAISCGIYGFPIEQACRIALSTLQEELATCPLLKKVYLVCFERAVMESYRRLTKKG